MTRTGLVMYASGLLALAICSACAGTLRQGDVGGAPPSAARNVHYVGRTLSVNGRLVTAARVNPFPRYEAAVVSSGHAESKRYEYVINNYGSYAGVFDYPKSEKEIGRITDVGGQGCTNILYGYGKKTFWIVAAYNQIAEYAVPKKLIETLSVYVGAPSSCAMDSSGDLAVGILDGSGAGDVVIFKNASGTGTVYTTPLSQEFFDGYDDQGNLFADGFAGNRQDFALVELPKGSIKFQTIATSNTIEFPGSVQWDGTYLTVLDQVREKIYQYSVSGTNATLQGTVAFSGSGDCAQTWIATGIVYCGDAGKEDGEVFAYPGGGAPIATLTGKFDEPLGVVAVKR